MTAPDPIRALAAQITEQWAATTAVLESLNLDAHDMLDIAACHQPARILETLLRSSGPTAPDIRATADQLSALAAVADRAATALRAITA